MKLKHNIRCFDYYANNYIKFHVKLLPSNASKNITNLNCSVFNMT